MIKTKCPILFRPEAAIVVDVADGDDEVGDGAVGDKEAVEACCVHAIKKSPVTSTARTIIVTNALGALTIGSLLPG